MPKPFTEDERSEIAARLKDAGRALFAANGVARTSVAQLADAAGIAKGSFYAFYPSKELLFFELLEEVQDRVRSPLLSGRRSATLLRKDLVARTGRVFDAMAREPLIRFMGRERDIEAVMRRVPPERLASHAEEDRRFIDALIARWTAQAEPPDRDVVAARLTLLVLTTLQRRFIGERLLPHARDAAIAALADCFFGAAPSSS